jgi:hypothetical protein
MAGNGLSIEKIAELISLTPQEVSKLIISYTMAQANTKLQTQDPQDSESTRWTG